MAKAAHFLLFLPDMQSEVRRTILAAMQSAHPDYTFEVVGRFEPMGSVPEELRVDAEEPVVLPILGSVGEDAGPLDEHPGDDVFMELQESLQMCLQAARQQ